MAEIEGLKMGRVASAPTKEERTAPYRTVRTIFECPILDDYKWAKIPSIPADMFFLDLEDSVPPARKEEARQRALEYLADSSYFGNRRTLARVNHLSTPWGHDDVVALALAGVTCMAYPKVRSADDLLRVISLLESYGASPDIFVCIETSGAIIDLPEISRVPNVVGLLSGPGDLSVDMGVDLLRSDGSLNPLFNFSKAMTSMAGAAHRLVTADIVWAPDYRDLDEIRRRLALSRELGFTAMTSFYPPHVKMINEIFTPNEKQVADAREMVAIYETVLAEGRPAALTKDGETILIHDYENAKSVIAKSELTRDT